MAQKLHAVDCVGRCEEIQRSWPETEGLALTTTAEKLRGCLLLLVMRFKHACSARHLGVFLLCCWDGADVWQALAELVVPNLHCRRRTMTLPFCAGFPPSAGDMQSTQLCGGCLFAAAVD